MKQHALVIDYKYCTGCHSCEIACRNEKGILRDQWGIKLATMGPIMLDGQWMWNHIPIPSDLCDLCLDRIEDGLKPACAHHCLAQCMEVVPLESLSKKMTELGNTAACYIP